jgi:hypothetical protein
MMNDATNWLAQRVVDAPAQLRARMLTALGTVSDSVPLHERLALAACDCLTRALRDSVSRDSALELLAADALLTHACEAAAELGSDTLTAFAAAWGAPRFEQLLPIQAK